jgi:hypothetical protein
MSPYAVIPPTNSAIGEKASADRSSSRTGGTYRPIVANLGYHDPGQAQRSDGTTEMFRRLRPCCLLEALEALPGSIRKDKMANRSVGVRSIELLFAVRVRFFQDFERIAVVMFHAHSGQDDPQRLSRAPLLPNDLADITLCNSKP